MARTCSPHSLRGVRLETFCTKAGVSLEIRGKLKHQCAYVLLPQIFPPIPTFRRAAFISDATSAASNRFESSGGSCAHFYFSTTYQQPSTMAMKTLSTTIQLPIWLFFFSVTLR